MVKTCWLKNVCICSLAMLMHNCSYELTAKFSKPKMSRIPTVQLLLLQTANGLSFAYLLKLVLKFMLTLYSAEAIIVPHRMIQSRYTGRWWVGCYIWYSDEGTGRGRSPPRPLLAVPNVTAHPSTASLPNTVLLL